MELYFPEDGYTARKRCEAIPNVCPEFTVVYRPCLYTERTVHVKETYGLSGDAAAKKHLDLIRKHVAEINGAPIDARLPKLRPAVTARVLDLVLGYEAEDETADLKI